MEFNLIPDKANQLNKNNEDYDIELLWYGFKNLIKNYFNYLLIDNKNIIDYTNEISKSLNSYQENKQFLDIYVDIYNYLIKFMESYISSFKNTVYNHYDVYKYNLVETWISRYNKIDYIKKIELPASYSQFRKLSNIKKDHKIYLKFMILGIILKDKEVLDLLDIYENNLILFIDNIIELEIPKIFDLISIRFNLQEYYDYKNIKQKYTPIKFNKFKKINL